MKSLNEYLDRAKAITGSDRQTALRIGCTPQHISKARKGNGFSDKFRFKLANLLEEDERLIAVAVNIEAKNADKEFWQEQWKKIAGAAACLVVAFGPLFDIVVSNIYYVKYKKTPSKA